MLSLRSEKPKDQVVVPQGSERKGLDEKLYQSGNVQLSTNRATTKLLHVPWFNFP